MLSLSASGQTKRQIQIKRQCQTADKTKSHRTHNRYQIRQTVLSPIQVYKKHYLVEIPRYKTTSKKQEFGVVHAVQSQFNHEPSLIH